MVGNSTNNVQLLRAVNAARCRTRNLKHSFQMRRPVFFFKARRRQGNGWGWGEACGGRQRAGRDCRQQRTGWRGTGAVVWCLLCWKQLRAALTEEIGALWWGLWNSFYEIVSVASREKREIMTKIQLNMERAPLLCLYGNYEVTSCSC